MLDALRRSISLSAVVNVEVYDRLERSVLLESGDRLVELPQKLRVALLDRHRVIFLDIFRVKDREAVHLGYECLRRLIVDDDRVDLVLRERLYRLKTGIVPLNALELQIRIIRDVNITCRSCLNADDFPRQILQTENRLSALLRPI